MTTNTCASCGAFIGPVASACPFCRTRRTPPAALRGDVLPFRPRPADGAPPADAPGFQVARWTCPVDWGPCTRGTREPCCGALDDTGTDTGHRSAGALVFDMRRKRAGWARP
jgi:hypothetical protein